MKKLLLILVIFLIVFPVQGQVQKITFSRDQVMLLTPQEETFMKMFDGNTTTSWFPGWGAMYPSASLVDLQGVYTIKQIRVKNYTSSRTFKIYGGNDPFNLTLIVDQVFSQYDHWYELNMDVLNVSYLKFEIPELKKESPTEIEIFAIKTGNPTEEPGTGTFRPQANINGVIGVNGFHWVDPNVETPFLFVREYMDAEWIQPQDEKYRYNPSWSGAGMFDEHYAQMKNMGYEVLPCIQGNLPWTRTAEYNDKDYKPVYPINADPLQPASYAKQAAFHFQFAARYGSTVVDESLVLVDPTPRWTSDPPNVKKSGLGLINYFECWNEPDKDWKGANGYMNPYEFAAYMSAVADGHCQTMGTTVGIKNADPTAKVVMGGLANLSLDYIKAMVLWFKKYRPDHSVPVDVFNFHHYANSAGFQHAAGSIGISPEQDQLREKLIKVKQYIDQNLPGKEVFLSEFGYDSNTGSIQRCEPIGTMSRLQVQGIWNVRTMLEIMASQIDRSYVYMIYDESDTETSSVVYGNSGMVTSGNSGSVKKPSWYYINTMKEVLKDSKFISNESPDQTIRKYKFHKDHYTIYVLWLTSNTDASTNYTLTLSPASSGELVTLADNDADGSRSIVSLASGSVNLNLTERPVFLIVDDNQVLSNRSSLGQESISMYAVPNPFNEEFTLRLTSPVRSADLEVSDALGRIILKTEMDGSEISIASEKMRAGIYWVKISSEEIGMKVIRVVKH